MLKDVLGGVLLQLVELGSRVFKILPRALRSDLQSALGVGGPAVVLLVPMVIGVLVVTVLDSIVSRAVHESLRLETLGQTASKVMVGGDVPSSVGRDEQLYD